MRYFTRMRVRVGEPGGDIALQVARHHVAPHATPGCTRVTLADVVERAPGRSRPRGEMLG